jgi:hypothetical protein
MSIQQIDTILDYLRLVAYATVVLTSLRGIAKRKFTNTLFLGDVFMSMVLIFTVIYIHLFEILTSSTILDDIILTTGAVIWAIVHFQAMWHHDKVA